MDQPAVGGDVFAAMCNQYSSSEEKVKQMEQATGDGVGSARNQPGVKYPPRVGKFNVHGYDDLGVKQQAYGCSAQTTPSLVHRGDPQGGVG
jgi:hypothetical protein